MRTNWFPAKNELNNLYLVYTHTNRRSEKNRKNK